MRGWWQQRLGRVSVRRRAYCAGHLTPGRTTRRRFLAGGVSAAAVASLGVGCESDPAAPRKRRDRPNVVVIVIDTLRADHVFGGRARTPSIDGLAREGLSFTRVHPEAMPTVPARNAILSGRRVFPFRGWRPYDDLPEFPGWAPLDDVSQSFTSVLRRAGYWTAYVTDNPFLGFAAPYERLRRSFDRFVRRGGQVGGRSSGVSADELRRWLPSWVERDPVLKERVVRYLANGRYSHDETRSFSARVFRSAADLLEAGARRRPFALVVDTFEPHEPWTPPRRYINMYGDPDYRGVEPVRQLNLPVSRYLEGEERELMLARMRALYAAEVTMTDRWLGVFLERLHDLRLERETVVVLVSDHGFYLGERGFTGKLHKILHPELTHVPLILVDPGRRGAGERSGYRASTHDVAPTLLSMTDVEAPSVMDGTDLSRLLAGSSAPDRPYSYGGYSDSFYIRSDTWAMFAENRPAHFRLFDLREDPGERRDVAHAQPELVRRLHAEVCDRVGGRLPYYA
jgi:arylsulfatase A-like enzyme